MPSVQNVLSIEYIDGQVLIQILNSRKHLMSRNQDQSLHLVHQYLFKILCCLFIYITEYINSYYSSAYYWIAVYRLSVILY